MRKSFAAVWLSMAAVATACGGGGGGPTGGILPGPSPGPIRASFTPDQPSPAAGTVSMAEASKTADRVTVAVTVTDTSGIYGAAFEVLYDAAKVSYVTWSPGTLLEEGGVVPNYTVGTPEPGRLVIGASRTGPVTGIDAVGTRVLVHLVFETRVKASSSLSFRHGALIDANDAVIPGIAWAGGTVRGS